MIRLLAVEAGSCRN